MINNPALEVPIALLATFLRYSLSASILMEAVAKKSGLRQRTTLKAINRLLDNASAQLPLKHQKTFYH
jgi:hypothetical protein